MQPICPCICPFSLDLAVLARCQRCPTTPRNRERTFCETAQGTMDLSTLVLHATADGVKP